MLQNTTTKLDSAALCDMLQRVKEDPTVTKLNLCRSGVTPSLVMQVADFLETNSTLTHIDLSGNQLNEHDTTCLAASLMKNNAVSSLILSNCRLTSDTLTAWDAFFRSGTNTTLRHLSLANNQIDDNGAKLLGTMLQNAKTRHLHFDLRGNELSAEGLKTLADAMKDACPTSVTAIQVTDNQDDDNPAAVMYRSRMDFYLRRNKAAIERETLVATISRIEVSSPVLVVCHLKHIVLTITDATSLGAALKNNHSVLELKLENNGLPEEGTRRICRSLHTNSSVQTLSFVDNNIGDGGFRALNDLLRVPTGVLRDVTVANSIQLTPENGLELIKPATGSALHYTFANYTLLTSLSLPNCGLNDLMVGVIVSGISWSRRIEALNLRCNSFGDRSIHVLARMMQRSLRLYRLDLSGNKFSIHGLLPLLPLISSHPKLRVLLFGRFLVYDESALTQLIDAAKQSRSLVQLEVATISRCSYTNELMTSLNVHLRAAHGAKFEREKQQRNAQVEAYTALCSRRALVHQQATIVVHQATSVCKLTRNS